MSTQVTRRYPADRPEHGDSSPGRFAETSASPVALETILYLGAIVLAFLLRLLFLDLRPLSAQEGSLAMDAYRLWQGQPPDMLHQGPLQAYGAALTLVMFGGGDGAVRLFSALSGTALVACIYLVREPLGRVPAVLAAYSLALSPLMLFASRSVGGGMPPLVLGVLLWWLLESGASELRWWRLYGSALALSGLIASGPEGITILLSMVGATLMSHHRPGSLLRDLRDVVSSPQGRRAVMVFAGSTLLVGTGFGTNPGGVQSVIVDPWSAWLGSLGLGAGRGSVPVLLALYELPVLFLGVVQLLRTVARRERADAFLSLWAMFLLLIGMAQSGGSVARLVFPLFPLYLLACRLIAESLGVPMGSVWGWATRSAGLSMLVPAVVGVVLMNRASTFLDVPSYYVYGELALTLLAAVMVLRLLDGRRRLALVWLSLAVLGGAYSLHNMVFLNYRAETASSEPVVGTQVSGYLRDAMTDAGYFANYFGTPLVVDPQLETATAWYLRGVRDVTFATEPGQGSSITVAQNRAGASSPEGERRPGIYSPTIDLKALSWQGVWRWMVARDGLVSPNQDDIIVRVPIWNR